MAGKDIFNHPRTTPIFSRTLVSQHFSTVVESFFFRWNPCLNNLTHHRFVHLTSKRRWVFWTPFVVSVVISGIFFNFISEGEFRTLNSTRSSVLCTENSTTDVWFFHCKIQTCFRRLHDGDSNVRSIRHSETSHGTILALFGVLEKKRATAE